MQVKIELKELTALQIKAAKLTVLQNVLDQINAGDLMEAFSCLELIKLGLSETDQENTSNWREKIKNTLKNYAEVTEIVRTNNINP